MTISVIVPAYIRNADDVTMLEECLDSIPARYEVVVWDDGSPYHYKHDFQDIVWAGGEHRGKSYARNRAVELATGPLIFPLDADDMLVPGALEKLESLWDGIPSYPDLVKLRGSERETYKLLDFDCDLILRKCVSSVNVLHTKEQWAVVGGWDETIEFYEDWEYNARLMSVFGGVHVSKPLVLYRIHAMQSVSINKHREAQAASMIRSILRRKGVGSMGCCGKHRRNNKSVGTRSVSVQGGRSSMRSIGHSSVILPDVTEEGKTLARYVGGQGQGKHYYRGPTTRYPYKVVHDQIMIVDDRDAVNPGQPGSLFVRIQPPPKPAETKPTPKDESAKVAEKEVKRMPRQVPVRHATELSAISITDMTVGELIKVAKSLTKEEAAKMIEEEKAGKNRVGAIKVLEKVVAAS